ALEIEEVLLSHPDVNECAVVGLPDEEWGEVVCAALIGKEEQLKQETFKVWLKDYLPPYKIPKSFLYLDALPRNAMGKVTKNELKKLFKNR
ncbi:MAG: AMP-binding enzyme, partial [Cyclobacteriaceae bacterium]